MGLPCQWYSVSVAKEIPSSRESSGKALRLREAVRSLKAFPIDRPLAAADWDEAVAELTQDELETLDTMARGHQERALKAARDHDEEAALDEAAAAVSLRPRDAAWARSVAQTLRSAGLQGQETHAFLSALGRRTKAGPRQGPSRWLWAAAALALALAAGLGGFLWLSSGQNSAPGTARVLGPRNLDSVFDTQGIRADVQVAQSRLLIFPDATVAELSAWVTFPDHRVDLWEGQVTVLDQQGRALAQRDVVFRPSNAGPLEAGQGTAVFQQFDAWPWFDKVASFQVSTSRILAHEARPQNRKEVPVKGVETLGPGFGLKVWELSSAWTDRFASKVQTLALDLENTGLKPFAELTLALVWIDAKGQTLKTLLLRPVSPFRTALPSGARLGWTQETVFDTEVFSWPQGSEPHPVLELRQWR